MRLTLGLLLSTASLVSSAPQSLVVSTPSSSSTTGIGVATEDLKISSFHVVSMIQLRYSRTVVESRVTNPDPAAQMAEFAVIIPDSAFISNFSMEVGGEEFVARLEEKEKAKKTFERAVSRGRGAGLVSQDTRDATRFAVSSNVEGGQEVVFRLTYDELLERKKGMYEQTINIDLNELVEDFKVEIMINETLPITTINVPELLESNEIDATEDSENSIAVIERNIDEDAAKAKIVFAPSSVEQAAAEEQGLAGRLIVRYDVDREGQDSEVQVIDGYFVHYFVPENLPTLPKHVIFILDTSGSMSGERIQQLKDAMFTVLEDMKPVDFFNVFTFSSDVEEWQWNGQGSAIPATDDNKKAAIKHVLDLDAFGGTNINSALLAGLKLAQDVRRSEVLPQGLATMILFLSDGEATSGETSNTAIKNNVVTKNSELKIPIFSIAFGSGADFDLSKDISLATGSFAKQVYEGSDAALQLENFYSEISSPLVTNLRFEYVGGLVDNSSISDTEVKTFFKGGQYVVVGKLQAAEDSSLEVRVSGEKSGERYDDIISICPRLSPLSGQEDYPTQENIGCIPSSPRPQKTMAQEFMQNLHAFLNIKQLLKKDKKEEALKLALTNNFVTPLTSLVVVRPGVEDSLAALGEEEEEEQFNYESASICRTCRAHSAPALAFQSAESFSQRGSSSYDYEYDDDYFGLYDEEDSLSNETTTTTKPTTCTGQLTLHSSTYHRGSNISLASDSQDLGEFSDLAVSAQVEGSCCWLLHGDPDFQGPSTRLSPGGDYKSTNSFGRQLFQEVSSVKKVLC